jgi:DNA-binding winged helix-turn-helix (wHTH) protein/tetratricopeptide (TPR) repeat protein
MTISTEQAPIRFASFVFDAAEGRLLRGAEVLPLRRRALAVLHYLTLRPGRLVTKAELFAAVWPDVTVSEIVLAVCISELRKALDDSAKIPRFIETVHGRGYRFIGNIDGERTPEIAMPMKVPTLPIVGRDIELARLGHHLDLALAGQRQIVFVTGDAGIGKTTVVESFLEAMAVKGAFWIARGQCAELHGSGEPFMPLLEGLGRLCREPGAEQLVPLLHEHAPSWLLQLPGLISGADREALNRQHAGVTRARMLREMVVGIEALTAHAPMVIVLEDLHWSDPSTFDLLAALAQRRGAARVLVIGTFRPVEVHSDDRFVDAIGLLLDGRHPCVELALEPLCESAIEEYLHARFGGCTLPVGFARAVHQRTGGNPLFIAHLAARAAIDAGTSHVPELAKFLGDIPASLRRAIEKQIGRLDADERRVLEAASVAGFEFAAAEVAAGLLEDVETVDAGCAALAQRQSLVRAIGKSEWPDGTISGKYAFPHALHLEVLHGGVARNVRRQLHQRIGERLESAYGSRAPEIAATLAVHFARSEDHARAFHFDREAGERAIQCNAFAEASAHFRSALRAFGRLPDRETRVLDELKLQLALGGALSQIQGFAAPEVGRVYARALALCDDIGDVPERFVAVAGLEAFYSIRGDLPIASSLGRQLLVLGESSSDRTRLIEAHHALGCNRMRAAEFADARAHCEHAITLCDLERRPDAHRLSGHDPKVCCLGHLACVQWLSGYPAQARSSADAALAWAEELAHPPTLALALTMAASVHALRREPRPLEELAIRALTVSAEYGLVFFAAIASIQRGCALAALGRGSEALELLHAGFQGYSSTGAGTNEVAYRVLAVDAYVDLGRMDDAQRELIAGFDAMERYGERHVAAELYRLKGELILREDPSRADDAEQCFRKALDVARGQHAKSLELRAALSMARLHERAHEPARALDDLRRVRAWFTEGFDAPDLAEAAAVLDTGAKAAIASRNR